MTITALRLKNFTAFRDVSLNLSPGINVLIGENATGKTHLLKVLYCSCDVSKTGGSFSEKLARVFLPYGGIGRLVTRQRGKSTAEIEIRRRKLGRLRLSFLNQLVDPAKAQVSGMLNWKISPIESAYIPVKEMLANAPGFRSLYAAREVHFEEVYADIVDRAYRPVPRGPMGEQRRKLLGILQKVMTGRVKTKNEHFFLYNSQGNLEFTLLAEGLRKLALLWLLIQNGTLFEGSVLFWDEPEANLNPKIIGSIVEILLELQRMKVQVFLATHNYNVLKEFYLRRTASDKVSFFSLFREKPSSDVHVIKWENYHDIQPNPIMEAFVELYDRELSQALQKETEQ